MNPIPDKLSSICKEIDLTLAHEQVRPEDVGSRTRLLRPLEEAVMTMSDAPQVPGSTAGKIAVLLWCKNHPQQADLDGLLGLLDDESSLVRLFALDAVSATLDSANTRWSEPQFPTLVHEALQMRREVEASPIITYNLSEITLKVAKLARPRKLKRPPLILNPYMAGLPVQSRNKFFGRQDVLRDIENSFGRREGVKSIVLYGARRTGKTSILYQIRDGVLGESFLPVYVDMQAFAGTKLPFFIQSLLLATENAAIERNLFKTGNLAELKARNAQFPSIQKYFQDFLAEHQDTTLLLMIDEYELLEEFFKESTLNYQLKSLLDREPRFYAIFAGSQKLETLKKKGFFTLLDTSSYYKISFLEKDEALQLIEKPAKGLVQYVEGVPQMILKHTAGHPFYTQLLCQLVFDLVKTGGTVNEDHVRQAVRQFLRNPSPHLILTWNTLDLEEKVVGSTLAELSINGSFVQPAGIIRRLNDEDYPVRLRRGEIQKALSGLHDIDWVDKKEGSIDYRYTMELVRRWVTENRSITDLVQEQRERIYSKVAVFWQQMLSWSIDFGLFGALVVLARAITHNASNLHAENWWYVTMAILSVLYFIVPPLIVKSTLGLHLLNLHVVSTLAGPPSAGRRILYGFTGIIRFVVTITLVFELLAVISPIGYKTLHLLAFLSAAIVTVIDVLMMLFGKKHQGLYDSLAGTLIISAKPYEENT